MSATPPRLPPPLATPEEQCWTPQTSDFSPTQKKELPKTKPLKRTVSAWGERQRVLCVQPGDSIYPNTLVKRRTPPSLP